MTFEDLRLFLIKDICGPKKISSFKIKKLPEPVIRQIEHHTSYLNAAIDYPIAIRAKLIINNIQSLPLCPVCNTENVAVDKVHGIIRNTCGVVCSGGNPDRLEKVKATCNEKFGCDNPMQNQRIKAQAEETSLKRYGKRNPIQNAAIKQKATDTMIERLGAPFAFQSPQVKEKIKATVRDKYGVDYIGQNIEIRKKQSETYYKNHPELVLRTKRMVELYESGMSPVAIAKELDMNFASVYSKLNYLGIREKGSLPVSSPHRTLLTLLDQHNVAYEVNTRKIIPPKELDIYLPDHRLAIEVNGAYWHSDKFKNRQYHAIKTKACTSNGIRLLQFWDFEINNRLPVVASIIINAIGKSRIIAARKCQVVKLDKPAASRFLATNHIQGSVGSAVKLGLVCKDELVAVMTFSKPRFSKKYQWELARFANKLGTVVVGGAAKLFAAFCREHSPETVVSYCDMRLFTGNAYEKMGFTYLHWSIPNYIYQHYITEEILTRISCQKHKLHKRLERFDPNLSEAVNMENHGYVRMFDAGNKVFLYTRPR